MFNILNRFSNKTHFKAGFLNLDIDISKLVSFSVPQKFIAPRKIDNRDLCLQSSNQGTTPHCAGYSTAGFIEVINWKKNNYPEQINGSDIYKKAKEIEGKKYDGTTLELASKAAINLKLITGVNQIVTKSRDSVKFAVHTNNTCIGGFLITDEWNQCNKKTGSVPTFKKAKSLGGHAVLISGYDSEGVYIQNSWGLNWGLYGFCFMNWDMFDKQFMYGMIIS